MLTRSSQVGEFYVMAPPQVKPKGENGLHTCDIMIFDEERDTHVRIGWREALNATLCAEGGDIATKHAETDVNNGSKPAVKVTQWGEKAEAWAKYNENAETTTDAAFNALDKDVRIIVARPFIEHTMHNVIMAVSGRDTGATLFGPADMQLSANTQVKTIEGHYTGHFKAVVTKPQNVLVMRDVACAGYVAGANTRWFAQDEAGEFTGEAAGNALQARLSFANDDTDRYASMLAFPCMEGQFNSGQLDTVMSVTSRLLPWEVNGAGLHQSFPGGNDMFAAYNSVMQLSQVHYGEDMKAAENQDFISQVFKNPQTPHCSPCAEPRPPLHAQGSTNNATCFLGPHRKYDPFTKSFMSLVPGQGHFGPDAIPGDARWRRGESVSLKAARDNMVSLELAQHAQMAYSAR
jgi:hypothetical protein